MSKRKKIVVLTCMIALLVTTAILNFVLTSQGANGKGAVTTSSYLTEYRSTLKTMRNEQLIQIDEIIASSADGSEEKTNALALKLKITEALEIEPRLEYLIKAQGYTDVAVTLSVTSDNYTVLVKDDSFDLDDAVKIYSVLASEVKVSSENVTIQPIST